MDNNALKIIYNNRHHECLLIINMLKFNFSFTQITQQYDSLSEKLFSYLNTKYSTLK